MNNNLRRQDDEMIRDLDKRLDRHIEIYQNNGKELARLSEAVEHLTVVFNNHIITSEEHEKKMQPVIEWFSNITFFKTAIMWLLGFTIALGAAYAVIKGFFK